MKKLFLLLISILLFNSCANVPQIKRGFLGKKIMKSDPHPEESKFRNEVRSFREGAIGGTNSVGGGCGCN